MPLSRPMPQIGNGCHELRVTDDGHAWRLVYRCDPDAVVVADVFVKTTRETPHRITDACRRRLADYDRWKGGGG